MTNKDDDTDIKVTMSCGNVFADLGLAEYDAV
jgi:hypothetical protein